MRALRTILAVALLSLPAVAAPNPELIRARTLIDQLSYKQALAALDAAWKRPNNDRQQVLEILELQGVMAATVGQPDKAAASFLLLLALDPGHALAGDHPPRVMTPFYEARGRAMDQALSLKRAAPPAGPKVTALGVEVVDPTKLGKRVRFHLKADGGAWTADVVDLAGKGATRATDAYQVEWWVELLTDTGSVIGLLGSEAAPLSDGSAPPPVANPPPVVVAPTAPQGPPWPAQRWGAVAVAGAGVVAAGVGVAMGLQANALKQQVDGATVNASGQVTGMTQARAVALDGEQRTAATVANVLFVAGGFLAASGVGWFIFSGSSEPRLAVTPAGAGLAVTGSF